MLTSRRAFIFNLLFLWSSRWHPCLAKLPSRSWVMIFTKIFSWSHEDALYQQASEGGLTLSGKPNGLCQMTPQWRQQAPGLEHARSNGQFHRSPLSNWREPGLPLLKCVVMQWVIQCCLGPITSVSIWLSWWNEWYTCVQAIILKPCLETKFLVRLNQWSHVGRDFEHCGGKSISSVHPPTKGLWSDQAIS